MKILRPVMYLELWDETVLAAVKNVDWADWLAITCHSMA